VFYGRTKKEWLLGGTVNISMLLEDSEDVN
jgi:hypothetical protein